MKHLIHNLINPVLLGAVLSVSLFAYASEDSGELCAPFKDAQIDQDVLAVMLKAAEDGDLYRINPDSSKMGFSINSPLGEVKANFRRFNGGLALKQNNQQSRAVVSIVVDSLEADSGIVASMMKSESFFNSELYPNIIFVSTGIEWITDKKAVLKGNLTMHGVTKTVAFYVDMKKVKTAQGEDVLTVKATTTIQRSEFAMHTLSPTVDDRVSLCMTVEAYRYKA